MLVNRDIIQEIKASAGVDRRNRGEVYFKKGKVNIYKLLYDNSNNFEVRATVKGNYGEYNTYIKAVDGEIEDLTCECEDYRKSYGTCKHIVATILELNNKNSNPQSFNSKKNNMYKVNFQKDYRIFKELINDFYDEEENIEKENAIKEIPNIKIEPKLIFNDFSRDLKVEFKVGDKNLYKIKSLVEFYDRMLKKEVFRYGQKLEFMHTKEVFRKECIPILDFILKYAEIIKYANSSMNNYTYYGRTLSDSYINVSNTGLDDLFEVLKNQYVTINTSYGNGKILLTEEDLNVEFYLEENKKDEYELKTNIDIMQYDILYGRKYKYFLCNDVMYRINSSKDNILKLLDVYKRSHVKEITFPKEQATNFFSVVMPYIKKNINLDKIKQEEIKKYIPEELFVKMFLDYNQNNYIVADIKFCYGDIEFNPLDNQEVNTIRNIVEENKVTNLFIHTGFMLDNKNKRLVLADEDKIYEFLSKEIEEYMQKFEVLVTDNFKNKEIRQPKIMSMGVKVENHLLDIEFNDFDFDKNELSEIMNKYKLKKKYHRLKDGSYLNLEQNETMDFIDKTISGMGLDYKDIAEGKIKLPVYRSMYLEKIMQNLKGTNINKDETYKKVIKNISNKEIDDIDMPDNLNANLREYQKTGYKWLKVLDNYGFGGILADDMGLGKTLQLISVILSYVQKEENTKPIMVVCPSSLTLNWYNEIQKFAPEITLQTISGNAIERETKIEEIENYNVTITSYDLLKRDIEKYKEKKYKFKYIIADEAQYIKNNNTQNSKAIKEIDSEIKYALTGTPIENSLSELWSIFDFILPGYLFGYKKFKELYETPIMKEQDKVSMEKLKMLIEPFILRRIKTEVLTELPDKTITVLNNQMKDEQEKLYLSYLQKAKTEAMQEIKANGIEKSQIKILSLLTRLRQICCHPSLFIENYKGESSKLNQCIEIVKDAIQAGHKILLFSGYTSMFEFLEKEFQKQEINYFKLTGQTKVGERIKLVDEFNENPDVKVFLISLKAGGTGLNLIGADMVIHYDPWWNLSAENQATDRTYRIGQKRNVQVYKLITKNSIEEKIYELQNRKAELIDNMLSTKETFINKLSKEEIMSLFG